MDLTKTACVHCQSKDMIEVYNATDFDSGKDSFSLVKCKKCDWVRTEPVLTSIELSKYFFSDYYGSGEKRFSSFFESLVKSFSFFCLPGYLLPYCLFPLPF